MSPIRASREQTFFAVCVQSVLPPGSTFPFVWTLDSFRSFRLYRSFRDTRGSVIKTTSYDARLFSSTDAGRAFRRLINETTTGLYSTIRSFLFIKRSDMKSKKSVPLPKVRVKKSTKKQVRGTSTDSSSQEVTLARASATPPGSSRRSRSLSVTAASSSSSMTTLASSPPSSPPPSEASCAS